MRIRNTVIALVLLAIVGGQPREMGLVEIIRHFIDHRVDVVRRRTQYDLRKAEEREHILLGFKKALDHLDEIIKLIRRSKSPAEAKAGLMETWEFSDRQAQAILDLQLHRLTQMERQKILDELKEIQRKIAELKEILASEKKLKKVIVDELGEIRKDYGDARRTQIVDRVEEIQIEDLIPDEDMAIPVSPPGYIKRPPVDVYRHQLRGGKGRIGAKTREEDFVEHLFIASAHSYILIFTSHGPDQAGPAPLLVLASCGHRVDTTALAARLGLTRLDRADAPTVREATGFAIGGVAPVGHPQPIRTVVDEALASAYAKVLG